MLRPAVILLFILTTVGTVLVRPATAQSDANSRAPYGSPPPIVEEPLPPPGAPAYNDRRMPYPREIGRGPPPTYAIPDELPETRRQLDEDSSIADAPDNDDIIDRPIRPPTDVGAAPPVPPGSSQPAAIPPSSSPSTAALPPEDRPEEGKPKDLPANLRRQLVDYNTKEPAGTVIIDTSHTYLYLVLGHGQAIRYGIGVGREGFTWAGLERVSRMKEWPDWFPPPEMIERQPYLPRMMAGGPGNPLGARALYLGHTLYRIHGTNQPSTIGSFVSSGCIRLLNEDIEDLYSRVQVGSRVVVLPGKPPSTTAQSNAVPGASATRASVMVEPAVSDPIPSAPASTAR
jgi:lipoprotein-anchoring transpeptidase ErfK/SrfK